MSEPETIYKILVVGDPGVGKTCAIKRYVHNVYSPNYKITIGVDFALKKLKLGDGKNISLQFWDIAGQERQGKMTRVYYGSACGAIVVFDMNNVSTFDTVKKWKDDIDSKVTVKGTDDQSIPVILLANKCDLDVTEDNDKKYCGKTEGEMNEFCKMYGFVSWLPVSAKNNVGLDDAMNILIKELLDKSLTNVDDIEIITIVNDNKFFFSECCS